MQCRYSATARDDLLGIARYIAQDNPIRARSFAAELRERCSLLARQSGMGRAQPELGSGIRLFAYGKYVILFSALPSGGVLIERVLHRARDLPMVMQVASPAPKQK
jgi:toxin ParE1/3/4